MIDGKKIYLNAIEKDDLQQLLKWRNDANNRQFYREYRELNLQQQTKWWEDKCCNNDSWQYFSIYLKQSSKMIGYCGLIYIDKISKSAECAFEIGDVKYRDNDYVFDALKTCLRFGFENLHLNRIWAEIFENKQYTNGHTLDYFFEQFGFELEGTKRDVAYKHGTYVSSNIYGALLEDWCANGNIL